MNALTIQLPKSEIDFIESYVKKRKLSVAEVVGEFIEQLRLVEAHPIHPEVKKMIGIIPDDIDVKKSYASYLEEKHQ